METPYYDCLYKPRSSSAVILAMRLLIIGTGRKDKADITGTVINKILDEQLMIIEKPRVVWVLIAQVTCQAKCLT